MDLNQIKIKEEPEDANELEEIGFNYDVIIKLEVFEDEIVENKDNFTNENYRSNIDTSEGKLILILQKLIYICLLYTSPSPRDATLSRMPSSA